MPPVALPYPCSRHARGVTLLELLVVMVIVAGLLALALPSLQELGARLGADLTRMQMVTAFNMARNTAITRSRTVAVCPSDDGRSCGDDWGRGWLIHLDRDAAPSPAAEDVLQYRAGSSLRGVRAYGTAGRPRLRFQRDGRSAGSTLSVTVCAGDAVHSRVIVNNVGRTRARRARGPEPCLP